ncbi:hypothetical protein [Pseudarthrobacter sp. S9]|uniref:hypothetical protein n=1 Tax=Pseudarthrobacter sp. S9 TaxID=3418421 RepID=UPI003CFEFDE4
MAGCGGPQKDATYENATKLRDAVIASGVECPGDAVKHNDKFGEDFVKCSASMGVSVFDKDADLNIAKATHDFTKDPYLAGARWLIQGDAGTLGKLKDKLGGSLAVP